MSTVRGEILRTALLFGSSAVKDRPPPPPYMLSNQPHSGSHNQGPKSCDFQKFEPSVCASQESQPMKSSVALKAVTEALTAYEASRRDKMTSHSSPKPEAPEKRRKKDGQKHQNAKLWRPWVTDWALSKLQKKNQFHQVWKSYISAPSELIDIFLRTSPMIWTYIKDFMRQGQFWPLVIDSHCNMYEYSVHLSWH